LLTPALELSLPFMGSGNTDSHQAKGELFVRVILGIAISLPIAAFFCLAYLTALAVETWRDEALIRRGTRRAPHQGEVWTSLVRVAA
jgi:hypothetical protein